MEKPLVVLSARDRYANANNATICGPTEAFLADAIGEDFDVTDDVNFWPAHGRRVIVCGQRAADAWLGDDLDILAKRGHVTHARMCEVVATLNPVDCVDVMDYEDNTDDDNDVDGGTGKDSAPTMRSNFRFWARSDIRKLINKERRTTYDSRAVVTYTNYVKALDAITGPLFLDIETHPPSNTIQCFAFSGLDGPVFSVPVYDHTGQLRIPAPQVFAALARAFRRCTVVGHNITFDLTFLAIYHGIAWGASIQDTMIQHHRAFPEAEKSLAHAISYWINAPYHKGDAGTFTPYNKSQYEQLLRYNAADVLATREVWKAQHRYSDTVNGLAASFASGNRSISPYARAGFIGFEFSESVRQRQLNDIRRRSEGLAKVFNLLAGYDVLTTSPKQLSEYLYDKLKLPARVKTDAGDASTGADAIYGLLLKHPDVATLKVLLAIRDLNKQKDQLNFKPYYQMEKR